MMSKEPDPLGELAMLRTKSKSKKETKPTSNPNGVARPSEVLTLDEAAAYLRVAPEDIVRMIEAEGLPGRKFGAEWQFFRAALQEWLSQPAKRGFLGELGKIKDDPYMEEMLREIYKRRGRPEIGED